MGKRKERQLSEDLGRLAAVAGATAAVAQTVATATDRAEDAVEFATETAAQVAEAGRSARKWLLLVAVLGVVGLVVVLLARRSSSTAPARFADVDAGPAAPVDVAVTTSA